MNTFRHVHIHICTHREPGPQEAPQYCHTWTDSVTLRMSYSTSRLGFSSSRTLILCQANALSMKTVFSLGELWILSLPEGYSISFPCLYCEGVSYRIHKRLLWCCEETRFFGNFISLQTDDEFNFAVIVVSKCTVMQCFIGALIVIIEFSNSIFLKTAGKCWISVCKSRKMFKGSVFGLIQQTNTGAIEEKWMKSGHLCRGRSNVELTQTQTMQYTVLPMVSHSSTKRQLVMITWM